MNLTQSLSSCQIGQKKKSRVIYLSLSLQLTLTPRKSRRSKSGGAYPVYL